LGEAATASQLPEFATVRVSSRLTDGSLSLRLSSRVVARSRVRLVGLAAPAFLKHGSTPLIDGGDHFSVRADHTRHLQTVPVDHQAQLPSEFVRPELANRRQSAAVLLFREVERVSKAFGRAFQNGRCGT
jgi:hypothetical protein